MTKDTINTILIGAGSGILMAVILLFLLQRIFLPIDLLPLLIMVALACALPGCLEVLGTRVDLFRTECITVGVSALIGIIYALSVSLNAAARDALLQVIVTVHICSALAIAIRQIVRRRGNHS